MRNVAITLLLFIMLIIIACKKENTPTQPTGSVEADTATYLPLKVGNYWVYQVYDKTRDGAAIATERIDSCFVSGDTLINDQTFFNLRFISDVANNTLGSDNWLRDSAGTITTMSRQVVFTNRNRDAFAAKIVIQTGDDTTAIHSRFIRPEYTATTVPAGIFSTVNVVDSFRLFAPYNYSIVYEQKFGKEIGIVSQDLRSGNTDSIFKERRLLRYHLE